LIVESYETRTGNSGARLLCFIMLTDVTRRSRWRIKWKKGVHSGCLTAAVTSSETFPPYL
jgi:hypothetical protein